MSKRSPILQPVCLAVVVGLGIQIVAALVVVWGAIVVNQFIGGRTYEDLELHLDGTPLIRTVPNGDYARRFYRTLDGKPVDAQDPGDVTLSRAPLRGGYPPGLLPIRHPWSARVKNVQLNAAIYWYFVWDGKRDGLGYFVGFDMKSKHCVGYVGRGGFRSDMPRPDDRFPLDGRKIGNSVAVDGQACLNLDNRVVAFDGKTRSVRTVLADNDVISISWGQRHLPSGEGPSGAERLPGGLWSEYLAVRTDKELLVLDLRNGARRSYPIPAAIGRDPVELYQLSDETAIVVREQRRPRGGTRLVNLYWIPPGGKPERHERVELITGTPSDDRARLRLGAMVVPVPAVWTIAALVGAPLGAIAQGDASGYSAALAKSLWLLWPALVVSLALAVLAMWLCLRRQAQYAMPHNRTWAVVVLLLGVPALLGYLFHRAWPTRIGCPACGVRVPRDRDACPRCNVPFPDPALRGTEVFA